MRPFCGYDPAKHAATKKTVVKTHPATSSSAKKKPILNSAKVIMPKKITPMAKVPTGSRAIETDKKMGQDTPALRTMDDEWVLFS